jgi:hypothetical protein
MGFLEFYVVYIGTVRHVGNILARANITPATRPKKMLAILGKLVGTLKRTIPARERGILFKDPTKLCVVGLVICINHMDVKLIASPSIPLNVMTAQNMGSLIAGELIKF